MFKHIPFIQTDRKLLILEAVDSVSVDNSVTCIFRLLDMYLQSIVMFLDIICIKTRKAYDKSTEWNEMAENMGLCTFHSTATPSSSRSI